VAGLPYLAHLPAADNTTTLTNLLYLALPVLLIYKGRARFWPEALAILGAVWFSMVYHQCRDAYHCPSDYTLDETGRLDMMAAYIALSAGTSPFIYCFVDARIDKKGKDTKLLASPNLRAVFFCLMTLVSFTLLTWTSPNEEYISFGVVGFFNLAAIAYCSVQRYRFKVRKATETNAGIAITCWTGGAFFLFTMSFAMFILFLGGLFRILLWANDISNYNTFHSLWHACGAVSGFIVYANLPQKDEIQAIEDAERNNNKGYNKMGPMV
jgi:hypothetical protein